MLALDTNVLVRIAVRDDPKQAALAGALLADETVWIGHTVLLETEWVLRARYGYATADIYDFLVTLLDYDTIVIEASQVVREALDIFAVTGEFSDALHVARMPAEAMMVTFDRKFARPSDRKGGRVKVIGAKTIG